MEGVWLEEKRAVPKRPSYILSARPQRHLELAPWGVESFYTAE